MKIHKKPLVSIIMNCHNGADYISRSVKSILKQSYSNWELIFWDNSSTDVSKKTLKKFKDKRIKYYFSKKFNSLYKSRNLAIKKAKGKYICFLDVDDQWLKKKIEKQVKLIEQLNCQFIYSNFSVNNSSNKKKTKIRKKYLPEGKITQALLNDYFLGILTVMMKRDLFKKYKFNNKYNVIGDFDLFIRLSIKYKFYCTQEPLAIYNVHGSNYSVKNLKNYICELKRWFKENKIGLLSDYNLIKFRVYILKLIIKNYFVY